MAGRGANGLTTDPQSTGNDAGSDCESGGSNFVVYEELDPTRDPQWPLEKLKSIFTQLVRARFKNPPYDNPKFGVGWGSSHLWEWIRYEASLTRHATARNIFDKLGSCRELHKADNELKCVADQDLREKMKAVFRPEQDRGPPLLKR